MEDLKKLLKNTPNIVGTPYGLQLKGSLFVDLSGQKRWEIPDKVIVKAAVTGALFSKAENPNHPCTPDEIKAAIAESIEAGALEHLTKPIERNTLLNNIEMVLEI